MMMLWNKEINMKQFIQALHLNTFNQTDSSQAVVDVLTVTEVRAVRAVITQF